MGGALSTVYAGIDQGYYIPNPTITEANLPDQAGKVFLITGANSGVGYEVSRILYAHNGTVYMACRNESKASSAIQQIQSLYPHSTGKLVFLHLDLSDLSTIKSTVTQFLSKESRLDWLNNNAGISLPPRGSKTAQGHEMQVGTNILGPFLLTKLLLPILKSTSAAARRSAPGNLGGHVRVSWAASFATDGFSPRGGVAFNPDGSIVEYRTDTTYAVSKAANWFLAYEFGKRSGDKDGVLHNAYNPGNLKTNLLNNITSISGGWVIGTILNWLVLYPARAGAWTELYAGLSQDLNIEGDQGGYVIPWGRKSTWNREDVVVEMREGGGSAKLWDWCERETKRFV